MNSAAEKQLEQIFITVVEGDRDRTITLVESALESHIDANIILQDALIPAMSEVGRLFEAGEFFVPEMLISARAMKSGLDLLKPLLIDADIKPRGKIALGTVQGDLHDIGKNLVGIMLEGAGFAIYDMGTDVSPGKVIEVIQTDQVDLVGLSALLTTTMPMMGTTIQALSEAGLREQVKVMVGGAPITKEYAENIGADGYAPDASQATKLALELIGESTEWK